MERPTAGRAALFGLTTVVAFLFRHDYGVYIGFASIAAFVLARAVVPEARQAASMLRDASAYTVGMALLLLPWAIVVQMSEGLIEYTRSRALLYERPSTTFVYPTLLMWNPIDVIASWFRAPRSPEAMANGALWLKQVGLLVPLVFLGSAVLEWRRCRARGDGVPLDVWRMLLAGSFLGVVAAALFREPSYVVVSVPVTAALSARLLSGGGAVRRTIAMAIVALTAIAAVVWTQESPLYRPSELPREVSRAFARLLPSPPVPAESSGEPSLLLQYLRDCSRPGDRLIVTGATPYQVMYFARRGPAGGHLYWRQGWRRDPIREGQSLEMLKQQSVPFAFSTNDPVLEDFKTYPRIRAYLMENYVELEGTKGNLLVDRRRQPTGTFGPGAYPCFQ
jgi:hypothetical protein